MNEPITKSIVIFGFPGCGKTTHIPAFIKKFQPDFIMDNWDGEKTLKNYTLALTNIPPPYKNKKVKILKWHGTEIQSILKETNQ